MHANNPQQPSHIIHLSSEEVMFESVENVEQLDLLEQAEQAENSFKKLMPMSFAKMKKFEDQSKFQVVRSFLDLRRIFK